MAKKNDTPINQFGKTLHKIVQIVSHDGKLYGLSDSGNLYEWEHGYDYEKEKVINKWNFQIASPIYGNGTEQILGELAKEILESNKK